MIEGTLIFIPEGEAAVPFDVGGGSLAVHDLGIRALVFDLTARPRQSVSVSGAAESLSVRETFAIPGLDPKSWQGQSLRSLLADVEQGQVITGWLRQEEQQHALTDSILKVELPAGGVVAVQFSARGKNAPFRIEMTGRLPVQLAEQAMGT